MNYNLLTQFSTSQQYFFSYKKKKLEMFTIVDKTICQLSKTNVVKYLKINKLVNSQIAKVTIMVHVLSRVLVVMFS